MRSTSKPQQAISITSGAAATICRQSSVRDRSPATPTTSSPPASRTSSGLQWPLENGGSIHSSTTTRGLLTILSARLATAATRARNLAISSTARLARPVARPTSRRQSNTSSSEVGSRLITRGRPESEQAAARTSLFGDGAYVAQRLGHDQVGLQIAERRQIERIEGLFRFELLAHEVDRSRGWRRPRGSAFG